MNDQMLRYVIFGSLIVVPIAIAFYFGMVVLRLAEKKGYPDIFGFLLGFYFGPFGILIARRMKPLEHKIGSGFDELLDAAEEGKKAYTWPVTTPAGKGTQLLYTRRRPSAVAALTLLTVTVLFTGYLRLARPDMDVESADVTQVPNEIGDWLNVGESTGDAELQKQIQADSYILRQYLNRKTGQQVELYLIYRRYGRREFNHNPDQCFPAGGYNLTKRTMDTLPYAGAEHQAVRMEFDGKRVERTDGKEGVPNSTVSYFFASGRRTEAVFLKQQMWMALEKMIPNTNGWTLLRLNAPWRAGVSNPGQDAWQAERDFMTAFGPEIEKVITTDAAADAKVAASGG